MGCFLVLQTESKKLESQLQFLDIEEACFNGKRKVKAFKIDNNGKAIKFLCADNDDIFLGYDKPEKTMDTDNSVITNKLIKR